ncbi:universal stress protein [Rhodopseudomonas palustris]|uniref:Universal stress protein n=1 Tax=Rhodopseudomonas palustris TaxID=1076 RepID=A0A418VQR9_RHOPL|nr:universal stress protein [Rhodopseudomonas palustris]RJF78696.1 universal stress protein [Rhodopseudomonas palustris]
MIKDILVRLDGTAQDDVRLAAADQIATIFSSHITGLSFISQSPLTTGEAGKEDGRAVEAAAIARLERLQQETHLRRFEVAGEEDVPDTAMRPARAADTFVELCPDGLSSNSERLIERLLFGAGRHLFLVPHELRPLRFLKHVIVAWNGSREAARAMAEAMPYLQRAEKVGLLVVEGENPTEADRLMGNDAVQHLRHHGINAVKHRAFGEEDETAGVLIEECRTLDATLLVMGSFGHSALHELLPGSTTRRLLRRSPIPLVIAH